MTKNAASNRVTVATLASTSLSSNEAGLLLPLAAQAAIDGKAQIEAGKAKGTAALAVMVAGFASDEVAARPWTFDVVGNDGQVKYHVESTGTVDFGGTTGEWRAEPKKAQTAYKNGLSTAFFNLPQSVPSVWTMISKAVPMARAIRDEGMTATIVDGELKLTGGTGERADAMRGAKSLSALAKVTKGETGTGRETHGNAKGASEGEGEARLISPAEVMALAARLCEGVAKGDEALSGTALSFARRIAELVSANPDAFAED
jgi:hypothetical protein